MILIDKQMLEKRDSLISPFSESKVGNISYDLTTQTFCNAPGKESSEVTLAPEIRSLLNPGKRSTCPMICAPRSSCATAVSGKVWN